RVALDEKGETRPGIRPLQRAEERRREDDVADQPQPEQEDLQGSMVASSISITGMSSLIGYTRRHCPHFNAVPFFTTPTFTLQLGHSRTSSSSGSMALRSGGS